MPKPGEAAADKGPNTRAGGAAISASLISRVMTASDVKDVVYLHLESSDIKIMVIPGIYQVTPVQVYIYPIHIPGIYQVYTLNMNSQ